MTLKEYQQFAKRTRANLGPLRDKQHMILGAVSEVGEAISAYKKWYAYNKEFDKVNFAEELGDLMWFCVNAEDLRGTVIDEIYEAEVKVLGEEIPQGISMENLGDFLLALSFRIAARAMFANNVIANVYWLCERMDIDFSKVLENNINKLKVRYPEKYSDFNATNRDLEAERKELEK